MAEIFTRRDLMERLTKRIIFGREVPTVALCNAPAEVCEGAKSCGSCDFLRDKIFQRLAAYEDTEHTPEECAAAFAELTAYRAAEQDGTLRGIELDKQYCDIANERIQKAMQDKVVTP